MLAGRAAPGESGNPDTPGVSRRGFRDPGPAPATAAHTPSPALATLIQFEKKGKTVPFMDQLWPNAKVQADHFAGVRELFDGKATPAQVLQQMDAACKGN